MSNVLIGIIGVILFIGLALAGALILGDDFRSASAGSRAAAETARLRQTAQAIEMKNIKTGTPQLSGRASSMGLSPRFIKSGANLDNTTQWGYIDGRGENGELDGVAPATYAVSGSTDPNIRSVCASAGESSGMTMAADGGPPIQYKPTGSSGCYLSRGGWGGIADGVFIMFQRI